MFKISLPHFVLRCTLILVLTTSCQKESTSNRFDFGTENDSALYYYNKGWEHIMDYGQWTLAEASYRKAMTFDPDFILGKGIVGKITTDLNERQSILKALEEEKEDVSADERLLLDDLLSILEIMNARDQGIKLAPEFYKDFYSSAESAMRTFIHKYPYESYIKAEYIEVIHSNHGAKAALDSIETLATESQKKLPFFNSYAATLESELANYDAAFDKAKDLLESVNGQDVPATYYTYAQLYLNNNKLSVAKKNIERAIQLDPKHQLAHRVKKVIDQKLQERDTDSIN